MVLPGYGRPGMKGRECLEYRAPAVEPTGSRLLSSRTGAFVMHMRAQRLRKGPLRRRDTRRALFFPSLLAWHMPAASKWPLIQRARPPFFVPLGARPAAPGSCCAFRGSIEPALQVSCRSKGLSGVTRERTSSVSPLAALAQWQRHSMATAPPLTRVLEG